jgi:RNA polymerase sigma-70 factor (ECF subfamily)
MYAPKMMGVCLRYMHNRQEAEDVLQESFIKVYLKINKYRFEGSFEGWLRRIVVNTALNKLRDEAGKDYSLVGDDLIEIINKAETIDNEYQAYTLDDMLVAIQQLSNMNRIIFNLAEIEGYTNQEIAQKLNLSENTIRGTLSRAKAILRTNLEKSKKQI